MPTWSPKRHDLLRDGRYALPALPGKRDDELCATGRARRASDDTTRALAPVAAKHEIRRDDWIFELDFGRVLTANWENVGQAGMYPVRQFWPDSKRGAA